MEGARPAVPADIDRLAALARQAIEELGEAKGGVVWRRHAARVEPVEATLAESLASADHLVLAGTIDEAVIGYAVTQIEGLPDGGLLAVVSDLYVEPEARGIGVGSTLMETILAWARERGCIGVDSLALPGSRATKNFFEGFGLVARAIVVHRDLERHEAERSWTEGDTR